MVNFPDDIMLDILVRLPVKSIGRFRCVNKAWCSLLKDPKFVKRHLKQGTQMNKFHLMLHNSNGNLHSIKTIGYDPLSFSDYILLDVEYPLKYGNDGVRCLGYSNGLVCCVTEDPTSATYVCIWNPSTNEDKKLPVTPPESLNGMTHFEYGFGYDFEIEDFKVVSLMNCNSFDGCWSEVQVYTLGSDSWRGIGKIPYDVYDRTPDMARVPVNGALHWIARKSASSVIISFHLEQEIIQEIALPKWTNEMSETSLCVLGGSLCLLGDNVDVWELWESKNCETEYSWTKLFTINPQHTFGFEADLMPLHKLENSNILLGLHTVSTDFHLIIYDPKQGTFTTKFYDEVGCDHFCTCIYVESLVSLNSGAYISAETIKASYEKGERWLPWIQTQDVDEDDYISGCDDADDTSGSDEEE